MTCIGSGNTPFRSTPVDTQSKTIFAFLYKQLRNLRPRKPHTRLLFCNREGRSTPETPRWKVAGRQSSSVSVLLPTGAGLAPSVSEGERFASVQQESIPWQSFVDV
jgi:hypothetical protein